ncbi:TonB-dependent outermembrane heme receptor HasR [Salinisphaera sp. PC39]|uniref:TonB-dependent hemoglobin/transferrin/lactoferrin family receptor n=1 Tax=Salinisphaera sp. PC39 TaxID=1304156 RepID=UPI00333EE996
MTADAALARLLAGSGLRFEYQDARTVLLVADRAAGAAGGAAGAATELGPIRVMAPVGSWVYETPRSVAVVTPEEIDRRPPRHPAEMLEEEAGVYSMFSEQDPALSVNIRGMQDYGRVNMMIDGARQNFQVSGHQQRNGQMYIDPELLAAVEIEKGPGAGVHGAGAIGGTANFRTIEPRDILLPGRDRGVRARATTGLGEYANGTDFIGSLAAAYRDETVDVLLAHSQQHLDEYEPGTEGSLGTDRRVGDSDRHKHSVVRESGRTSRSTLAKAGLMLTGDQRVGVSFLDTDVAYDASSTTADEFAQNDGPLYQKRGEDDVTSRTYALDYDYGPRGPWVDLEAKLYYVTTRLDQRRRAQESDQVPDGMCADWYATYDPIPDWVSRFCTPAYAARYRTDTWGLQVRNISRLVETHRHALSADYGIEAYTDETDPEATLADPTLTFESSPIGGLTTATPAGERDSVSVFTALGYDYAGVIEVDIGLRYDHYNLRGHTGFRARNDSTGFTEEYDYDIDRTFNRVSPTLSVAVRANDWLQPYIRWGRAWRMPAITETLITGAHVGDARSRTLPNPELEPERSETWEAGFNIGAERLFTDRDVLHIKFSYFDTRIEDFIYMSFGKNAPHQSMANDFQMAYDNSVNEARFRGTELNLDYDAGAWYAGLNYTNMVDDNKGDLCSRPWYLGYELDTNFQPANDPWANCAVFGAAEYPPPDKLNIHAGVRLLDRALDIGVKVRHAEGFNESVGRSGAKGEEYAYPPVWDEYTVWDWYGRYRHDEHLSLRLTVDNVFDRAYLVNYGDPLTVTLGRGRTVQGSVELRF